MTNKNTTHHNKKVMRRSISFVLSYLLTLIFAVLFILVGILAGVFNDSVILNHLQRSNYYQSIYTTIQNNAESVLLPTGIDISVLSDVITMDRVYIAAKNTIEAEIKGESVVQDTKRIKNQLKENILRFADEKELLLEAEQQVGVETLCEAVSTEYTKMLDFPFIKYYVQYKTTYQSLMRIGVPILLLLATVIIVILLKLHKYQHQGVRYVAYSVLAASIMITIVPVLLLVSKAYQKLNVSPKYFYNFMVNYIRWDISVFVYIGGIGLAIFTGLLLYISILKKKIY